MECVCVCAGVRCAPKVGKNKNMTAKIRNENEREAVKAVTHSEGLLKFVGVNVVY